MIPSLIVGVMELTSPILQLTRPFSLADFVRAKSIAAAGLTGWVINIVRYYKVYCDVEPKRQALEGANATLASSQAKLAEIQSKIGMCGWALCDSLFSLLVCDATT